MKVFDKYYAQYYNLLYKDKDYESESKYIISLFIISLYKFEIFIQYNKQNNY